MITRLRPRHYCEFCKKSGCRKDLIASHEIGCTANPSRVCGCCRIAGRKQPTMGELFEAARKDLTQFGEPSHFNPEGDRIDIRGADNLLALVDSGLDGVGGCPACMLAVMRQFTGGRYAIGFDFKKAMDCWIGEFGTRHNDGY